MEESKIENTVPVTSVVDPEKEKIKNYRSTKFLNVGKNAKILKALLEGKPIEQICNELKLKPRTFIKALQQPYLLDKLEDSLNLRLFDLNLKKAEARLSSFALLKKEFESRISEASADTIVREYFRTLGSFDDPKKFFPKIVNLIITQVSKRGTRTPEEVEADLEKDFGFKRLKLNHDGTDTIEPAPDIAVDQTDGPEDKQESED
jgi:hypothetical protein